jgi:DHA1 family bicyclomycin/chloramphenicol resistance-like MFS transporter
MRDWRKFLLNFLLVMMPIGSSLCIDMYLPAYPAMAKNFAVSVGEINLSMSVYLAGIAIGQLIYGPISDRFGRRKLLVIGFVLFSVASIICTAAPNLTVFLVARLVQALGACSGIALCRAVVIDTHAPGKVGKILALISASNIISPALAPLLGGVFVAHFNWRIIFLFISLYGIVLSLGIYKILPETLREPVLDALQLKRMGYNLKRLFSSRIFQGHMIGIALMYAMVFVWVTFSPGILIDILQIPTQKFGFYFMLPGLGCTFGALLTSKFSNEAREGKFIAIGYGIILLSAIGLLLYSLMGQVLTPFWVTLPLVLIFFSIGLIQSLQIAKAIAPFTDITGFTVGILGSIPTATASLFGALTSVLYAGGVPVMALLILLTAVGALLGLFLTMQPRTVKKTSLLL